MQNFEDIEDLVSHMFEKLDGDNPVSVVADTDLAVGVMKELLDYDNVILSFADVDTYDYDKEYIVSLYDEVGTDYWYASVEKAYNYEDDMYFGTDGYVLFHEDVNSKALVDMQKNEFIELSGYDWFVVGEDEETDDIDAKPSTTSKGVYKINGKQVSCEEFENKLTEFEDMYMDNIQDMLIRYADFMDNWNEWLKLLY